MTKKEYCMKNPAIAYYSGLNGLEIHGIEYGIEDYIYCVSGAWSGCKRSKRYHKVKIQYISDGTAFFVVHGYRIPLDECIRMGV